MDFITDNNPKTIDFVKSLVEVPSYVDDVNLDKTASAKVYADQLNKEYPIDTRQNTWLSYAYIKAASTKPIGYSNLVDTIELAAAAHGIHKDIKNIDHALQGIEKQASTRSYALSIDDNGQIKHYYPINTSSEIEKSAAALVKDYAKMPIEFFHDASVELVKSASKMNLYLDYLPQRILDHGLEKEANFAHAAIVADLRKHVVADAEAAELYKDTVKLASEDPKNVRDYIDLFATLDRAYDVDYKGAQVDPFTAFYSGMLSDDVEKIANTHTVIAGTLVPYSDIADFDTEYFDIYCPKESSSKYKDVFEKSASALEFTQNAGKLDNSEQAELLQLLAEYA